MKKQILINFLAIFVISSLIVSAQKTETKGGESKFYCSGTVPKKVNIFKWTTSKDYRRCYIKLLNKENKE